jgi:hypothetical protein
MNSPYADSTPNRETVRGRAIDCIRARLSIGGVQRSEEVGPRDEAVVFEIPLAEGRADLRTWLVDRDGAERGAYFVQAQLR